jgi:hypothetical protein
MWVTAASLAVAFVAPAQANAQDSPTEPDGSVPPELTGPPEPGEEIIHSFTLTPAGDADDAPGSRTNLSYIGDPGESFEDEVTVFNLGNEQLTFRVYATDAFNAADGTLSLLDGSDPPTDVGTWVTFPQELITIPAKTQATFPVTITIPDNATPGDHTGAVLASSEALSTGNDGAAVVVDRRTGTRLLVRVNGPIRPELAIEDLHTSYHHSLNPFGGSAEVTYTIHNRGNVRLAGSHQVVVEGPFGLAGKRAPMAEFPELLPGQSIEVTTEISGVPALMLAFTTVTLEADAGGEGAMLPTVSRGSTAFAPPITLLLVLLLVLFTILARRARNRHRSVEYVPLADVEVLPPAVERQTEDLYS